MVPSAGCGIDAHCHRKIYRKKDIGIDRSGELERFTQFIHVIREHNAPRHDRNKLDRKSVV